MVFYGINDMLEKDIQNQILEYYGYGKRYRLARMNSGGMHGSYTDKSGRTKKRFMRFNHWPGISDIIGIQMGTGRWVALEVKQPGGKPTELQQTFLDEITEFGGIAGCVHSVDEAIALLGKGL